MENQIPQISGRYVTIQEALAYLEEGKAVRHINWQSSRFIYKQLPNNVDKDVFPKMASVPEHVKELLRDRDVETLMFRNQYNLVDTKTGLVTSWRYEGTFNNNLDWEVV